MSATVEAKPASGYLFERDVRCSHCDKLLTKVKFFITVPVDKVYGNGSSVSEFFQGIEIKMGLETKCNRCKHMNHELNVI